MIDDFDDKLFSDEIDDDSSSINLDDNVWKLLIVDDDEEVHSVTKLVISGMIFENRAVEIYSVYSGKEAREFLKSNNDITVILLDVVMESDDEGLKLAKYIREDLSNKYVRIILRTGQPGMAPESEVITKYDINDYRAKTDLSSQKLFTSVLTAIRGYRDLMIIKDLNDNLEQKVMDKTELLRKKHLELSNAYNDLKSTQGELVRQERLVSVGNLASGIAHEINNPLSFIKSNITVLSDYIVEIREFKRLCDEGREDEAKDFLGELGEILDDMEDMRVESLSGVEKVADIVQSLKDYSKVDSYSEKGSYDLNNGVSNVFTILRHRLNGVEIDLTLDPELNLVYVDASKINQALLNLVQNSIAAVEVSSEKYIRIKTYNCEDYICCELLDSGSGVPLDVRDKIFDPFFTTKDVGKGTGLGLSIAYDTIVNNHRGVLKLLDSDKGAKFLIKLPTS